MRSDRGRAPGILRDTSGNVLPIAAAGLVVATIIVGSAIDLSRSYNVQNHLQAACDAAVLAGRHTVTTRGFDDESETVAKNYFATNFNQTAYKDVIPSFSAMSDDGGKTVKGTASAVVNTLVMRLFGMTQSTLTVTCSSSMGVGNADVMMVLDTTGSMGSSMNGGTRISALQDAMKSFYQTLQTATANSNARIRYGFVPYSSSVNVGRLIYDLDPRYLVDSHNYQSREYSRSDSTFYDDEPTASSSQRVNSPSFSKQSDCEAALPQDDTEYTNSGNWGSTSNSSNTPSKGWTTSTRRIKQVLYKYDGCQKSGSKYYFYRTTYTRYHYETWTSHYEYKQRLLDTSVYKTFNTATANVGSNGSDISATWDGCIEERKTQPVSSFSYSPLVGMSPADALDVDLDAVPDVSNDDTKWAPMWPEVAYRRYDDDGNRSVATQANGSRPGSYCPAAAQMLTEMDESTFNAYADKLKPEGSTYLDIGMIWGGRLLSPQGLWQSTVNDEPDNGGEVSRHIIFMTDGIMEPNYDIQSAWGIEWWDRRVTDDGSSNDAARHTQRFRAVCEAIKDKNIRLWVIAFTSGLSNDLKACASDNSSFSAANSSELNKAFQEIAKQVGELRVVE